MCNGDVKWRGVMVRCNGELSCVMMRLCVAGDKEGHASMTSLLGLVESSMQITNLKLFIAR